jgi:hypothetical protein
MSVYVVRVRDRFGAVVANLRSPGISREDAERAKRKRDEAGWLPEGQTSRVEVKEVFE